MCISRTEKPRTTQPLKLAPRQEWRRSNLSQRLGRIVGAHLIFTVFAFSTLLQTACVAGPKYTRPSVPDPPAYKELSQEASQAESQWKIARPNDAEIRGKWWEAFHDPQLNELEEKAFSSNQNIAAAAANFLAARALVRQARSQYFPTVSTNPSIMTSRPSPGQYGGLQTGSSSGVSIKSFTDYSLSFDASWEPDFWGHVRSTVRSNIYAAPFASKLAI
jgi:outer membrane protein TolC